MGHSIVSRLRDDERGLSAIMLMGAVVVFAITGAAVTYGLIASMSAQSTIRVNSSVQDTLAASAGHTAMLGYDAASTLPADSDITISAGGHDITVRQVIDRNPDTRTARVTLYAGKYTGGEFTDPHDCDVPGTCTISTELFNGVGR